MKKKKLSITEKKRYPDSQVSPEEGAPLNGKVYQSWTGTTQSRRDYFTHDEVPNKPLGPFNVF